MPRGHRHTPETLAKIAEASKRPMATEAHDAEWKTPADYVDATMTAADFEYVLENLRFEGSNRIGTLELDKYARDFILTALRRRNQPASS
jgi:hypothetical protein